MHGKYNNIRFFKKIKKSTKCDVCLEITTVVKVCKCSFNICSTCIKCLHNENKCPYCRCSHMDYLNTITELTPEQEKIKIIIIIIKKMITHK